MQMRLMNPSNASAKDRPWPQKAPGPGWADARNFENKRAGSGRDRNFFIDGTGAGPGSIFYFRGRGWAGIKNFEMTGAGPGLEKLKMPGPGRDCRLFKKPGPVSSRDMILFQTAGPGWD